jgi:hypothetical protein
VSCVTFDGCDVTRSVFCKRRAHVNFDSGNEHNTIQNLIEKSYVDDAPWIFVSLSYLQLATTKTKALQVFSGNSSSIIQRLTSNNSCLSRGSLQNCL